MAKLTIIEGTPEEVVAIAAGIGKPSAESSASSPPPKAAQADSQNKLFVTTDIARKVFNRRPLSPEQKIVVATLGKAYPNWVVASELQTATGYTPAQFAGLMGAFGRRFSHTQGFVSGSWLFDTVWNDSKCTYEYKLPESVWEAAKSEGLL